MYLSWGDGLGLWFLFIVGLFLLIYWVLGDLRAVGDAILLVNDGVHQDGLGVISLIHGKFICFSLYVWRGEVTRSFTWGFSWGGCRSCYRSCTNLLASGVGLGVGRASGLGGI